jgi:hypothetical protein
MGIGRNNDAGSGSYPETDRKGGLRADASRESCAAFANSVLRGTWNKPVTAEDGDGDD